MTPFLIQLARHRSTAVNIAVNELDIGQKLTVQGVTFPISEGNIFLVTGADNPTTQKIQRLGTFPLNSTEGEPLSSCR